MSLYKELKTIKDECLRHKNYCDDCKYFRGNGSMERCLAIVTFENFCTKSSYSAGCLSPSDWNLDNVPRAFR